MNWIAREKLTADRIAWPRLIELMLFLLLLSVPLALAQERPLTGHPWEDMDYGPFLSATVEAPWPAKGNLAVKGLLLFLRPDRSAVALFDTDLLRVAAVWTSDPKAGPIDWRNIALNGEHQVHSSLVGTQLLGTRRESGWGDPRDPARFEDPRPYRAGPLPRERGRWRGLYLHGDRVVLSYSVGETAILESWDFEERGDLAIFERTIDLEARAAPLRLKIADAPGEPARGFAFDGGGPVGAEGLVSERGLLLPAPGGRSLLLAAVSSDPGARFVAGKEGAIEIEIPPGAAKVSLRILQAAARVEALPALRARLGKSAAPHLALFTRGGPARWGKTIETRGLLGAEKDAYAVDDLAVPLENPYHSWLRPGGFDFFPGGDSAALCTWGGDVWTVSGIDAKLEKLLWRRIAAGLFQPLGLKIVDGKILVLGRDQITVLRDLDGDGETDFYECFNHDAQATEHFHEFAMDLEEGPDGDLLYMKGACHAQDASVPQHGTLLRVARDGSATKIVCGGFRAPNGLAVGPRGELVTTDQEGHWTPENRIDWLEPGGFYGYRFTLGVGLEPEGERFRWRDFLERPPGYDRPLCWIHKNWDRSPSAPVFVAGDRWGLPAGSLVTLSYGTGKIFRVLHELVDGQIQGGIVRLPAAELPTGIHRGRFRPEDGQLYVCGLFGWSSNKTLPGGLYRIRRTSKPLVLPEELHATRSGALITFPAPLDRKRAVDPGSYSVEAWNYHYREDYGSEDFRLSAWTPGRDRLEVTGAKLSRDRRSVFLRIPAMPVCMQMLIQYRLEGAGGEKIRGEILSTVNLLGELAPVADRFEGGLPEAESPAETVPLGFDPTAPPANIILRAPGRFEYEAGTTTVVTRVPEAAGDPLLELIASQFRSKEPLRFVLPLPAGSKPLLQGQAVGPAQQNGKNEKRVVNPVAWIEKRDGKDVLVTTLGSPRDLEIPAFRRLLANAAGRVRTADGGGMKSESFDRDPGWQGMNHRAAREREPATIREDFGYSHTSNAGGRPGEIGGFITPAAEAAYYAKVIEPRTLDDPLRASGTFSCPDGPFHLLLGYFNAETTNEWRTPNTIAIRLNGRGDHFFAYVEYCTSRWRAGGDTRPFPAMQRKGDGRSRAPGFPSGGKTHAWSLVYDPRGGRGEGSVKVAIDDETAECDFEAGHHADGARFDRFGILNILKSADSGGEFYLDDLTLDGKLERFDADPLWEGKRNRVTYRSPVVRPRCDLGFSPTNFAGGKSPGELGGLIFRGDCRYPEKMTALGDAIGPLGLEKPLRASGRIAMTRGVSDSTTLFGFYHSRASLRSNESQKDGLPEGVLGIQIEGPSGEGFYFYPVYRIAGKRGRVAEPRNCPRIAPDRTSHDFSLEYDPSGAGGKGKITITLDRATASLDLEEGARGSGARFDRFGIVTSWIDGNSQNVYWDDLSYTARQ